MEIRRISMLNINKKYDAESLLQKYNEYIDYCLDVNNSIEIPELMKAGELAGQQKELKIKRQPTIPDFCDFCDIVRTTFYNYCDPETQKDERMLHIATRIHEAITSSLLQSSIHNRINALIGARLAGINETINVNNTGNQQPINISINGKLLDLTK